MRSAIIPARGGSKRIPRKNIKEFCGRPIIAYAVEAAIVSGCFQSVVVSSDDSEILRIAAEYGAETVRRSDDLSGDYVGTAEVVLDYLQYYSNIDDICCIYPCNPFLTGYKIEYALDHHYNSSADSTFPVIKYSYPPQRGLVIKDGQAEMLEPQHYPARSQDLEPIYHDAGQFYWLNVEALRRQEKLFMARSTPLIYNEMDVQDIDTVEDWTLAEVKYQLWRNNSQFLSSGLGPKEPLDP